MKLLFFTDLHAQFDQLDALPRADLLVFGGDLTQFGKRPDVARVLDLLASRYALVVGVLGNCDPPDGEKELQGRGIDLNLRFRDLEGYRFVGCSGSNKTPFGTPTEWCDQEQAARLLAQDLAPKGESPHVIAVSHAPPLGSGADRLPGGKYAGSDAVAALVKRLAPTLVLCGHIHDARGVYSWEETTVVNPGPLRLGHYATVQLVDGAAPDVTLA